MFENILNFFKKLGKNENKETSGSKTKAKERLHLVLMQDRANVSADFLEMMKQEIIDVIKKYIEVEENEIDVRLTNEVKEEKKEEAKKQEKSEEPKEVKEEIKVEEKEENVEETSKQEEQEEVVEEVEVKEETKKD